MAPKRPIPEPYVNAGYCYSNGKNIPLNTDEWRGFLRHGVPFRFYEYGIDGEYLFYNVGSRITGNVRYWYASKQVNGRRRTLYLGHDEVITAERLQDIHKKLFVTDYAYWIEDNNHIPTKASGRETRLRHLTLKLQDIVRQTDIKAHGYTKTNAGTLIQELQKLIASI